MPLDPSIPLQVRPQQPINPFGDIMQIMALKQAQQLLPLKIQEAQTAQKESALRLQQMTDAANDRKAQDAAWTAAISVGPDGKLVIDRNKALQNVPGHLAGQLTQTFNQMDKSTNDLLEQKQKIDAANAEHGGSLGLFFQHTNYDPAAAKAQIASEVSQGTVAPQNAKQVTDAIDAAMQQDPTGAAASGVVKQFSQKLLDMAGPKFSEAQSSAQTAASRQLSAQTGQTRETRESGQQAYTQAAGALATNPPPSTEAYQQFVDSLPHGVASRILQAVPIEQYDPKTAADAFNKAGMTADQRYKADNPNATGERNPTEASLAMTVAKGKRPGATPEDVQASRDAEIALKRLDQSKREARPSINVNMTPAQADTTADMIGQGKIDPTSVRTMLRRQPGLLAQVVAKYPGFDEADIDNRYNTAKEFSSSSNTKAGGQVLALNTLIHHADLYQQVGESLHNGTFVPGNAAYNAVASMFGSAPPQNANLVARFLAGETGKVATGGVPAEGEINGILQSLSNNASPEQIKQAGQKMLEIASGRMIPLKEKRDNAKLTNQFPIVGQDAAAILQKRGIDPNTLRPAASGGQSSGAAAQGGYIIGHKYGGLTYNGGDPTKKENWK